MDIIVKNICRSFDDKKVLRNFSAVFKEGECTCIMGESGCGKTTRLNILMGLMPADSGEISGMPDKKSAVFQEDRLSPTLTAIRNVKITAGRISKHELINSQKHTRKSKQSERRHEAESCDNKGDACKF